MLLVLSLYLQLSLGLAPMYAGLALLAIASLLIFRIPKGRGRDPVPGAETVLEA